MIFLNQNLKIPLKQITINPNIHILKIGNNKEVEFYIIRLEAINTSNHKEKIDIAFTSKDDLKQKLLLYWMNCNEPRRKELLNVLVQKIKIEAKKEELHHDKIIMYIEDDKTQKEKNKIEIHLIGLKDYQKEKKASKVKILRKESNYQDDLLFIGFRKRAQEEKRWTGKCLKEEHVSYRIL